MTVGSMFMWAEMDGSRTPDPIFPDKGAVLLNPFMQIVR